MANEVPFESILEALGCQPTVRRVQVALGGDTCRSFHLETRDRDLFVKITDDPQSRMFAEEARALQAIAESGSVTVPHVLGHGSQGSFSWLALDWLDIQAGDDDSGALLGAQIASMHRSLHSQHGWVSDNFIGPSQQFNSFCEDWAYFFQRQRLMPQFQMLATRHLSSGFAREIDALLERVPTILEQHCPAPSLLHGDLWGGNWGRLSSGSPVVFDPASYWGDRETDLAMTTLFGGFPKSFHDAYDEAWPLPDGWSRRRPLYQLYHWLNHANLFGGSYLTKVRSLVRDIVGQ